MLSPLFIVFAHHADLDRLVVLVVVERRVEKPKASHQVRDERHLKKNG